MWITRHTLPSSCGRCLQNRRPAKTGYGCRLCAAVKSLIHQLKFSRRVKSPAPCHVCYYWKSYALVAPPGCKLPDRIISVPLWQRRHWRRGFNQSDLLCQPLSRWFCIANGIAKPFTRTRATATQHFLSARLRKRNLKNAFRLESARARSPYGDCG